MALYKKSYSSSIFTFMHSLIIAQSVHSTLSKCRSFKMFCRSM